MLYIFRKHEFAVSCLHNFFAFFMKNGTSINDFCISNIRTISKELYVPYIVKVSRYTVKS